MWVNEVLQERLTECGTVRERNRGRGSISSVRRVECEDCSVSGFDVREQFSEFFDDDVSVDGVVFAPLEGFFFCELSNFLPVGGSVAGLRGVLRGGTSFPVDEVFAVCGFVQRFGKVVEVTQVYG